VAADLNEGRELAKPPLEQSLVRSPHKPESVKPGEFLRRKPPGSLILAAGAAPWAEPKPAGGRVGARHLDVAVSVLVGNEFRQFALERVLVWLPLEAE
jgi:hypothetical protein